MPSPARREGGCDFVSESMKPEHEKVVIDMISRSFADKGDLTTLAGVNYDNLYEQGSLDIHYIKIGRYFSVSQHTGRFL